MALSPPFLQFVCHPKKQPHCPLLLCNLCVTVIDPPKFLQVQATIPKRFVTAIYGLSSSSGECATCDSDLQVCVHVFVRISMLAL